MFHIAATTLVGLVREVNEDSASVNGQRLIEGRPFEARIALDQIFALVADGMGGHARGEIASDTSLRELENRTERLFENDIIPAIRAANRAVYDLAASNPVYRGMGSTLVGVVINEKKCTWFNVGDSRAYLCRSGKLLQLSKDHVPPMVRGMSRSHAISQSLGGAAYYTEIFPSTGSFNITPGDRILLCSDGLTDVLSDQQIEGVVSLEEPGPCVTKLAELVVAGGAPDNATLVLLAFG
ncbi:PP2C family protein-serine/threonine phosphatase [Sinorhizobium meliloti]|uniref:PP2C family protein-serine/threonine phosphatase n=1 Tax=Rhizobium meliloti TaxID=382 RepID=UPI002090AA68|nr:protein phosphatase 2C domain-containing protein [Sinorhizobium meliloti]MCO5966328.1 protein phosphatase 2C domain-containing protein [Sinorhizobium meliloti]